MSRLNDPGDQSSGKWEIKTPLISPENFEGIYVILAGLGLPGLPTLRDKKKPVETFQREKLIFIKIAIYDIFTSGVTYHRRVKK